MLTDNNRNFLKNSLAKKVTVWILAVSGIFTLSASTFQLYMDFRSGREDIEKVLSIIESSQINSLKNSIWDMNIENIDVQLDEMLQLPNITYVNLQMDRLDNIIRGDIPHQKFQIKREYPLYYEIDGVKEKLYIGLLSVTASLENIYIALKDKAIIIIISQTIKTFFVSFFILFLIYSLITRHLERISIYLANINLEDSSAPLTIDKRQHFLDFGDKDELDLLVLKINSMQAELRQSIKGIKKINDELNDEIAYRKKAEEELKKSKKELADINAGLEELVEERTRESEKAAMAARAANNAKSDFLARMSHEIRTPMNGIIGLTDLLFKSKLTSHQNNYLKKIRQASGHLLNIINDLLDFSKIEEGRLEIDHRNFMLNHVIGKVAEILGARSAQKEVELFYIIDKMVPLSLKGDPLRLNQILINLMGNAVKFTEQGQIILKVRIADFPVLENISSTSDGEQVGLLFSVQDTGIGISSEHIDTLFHPFTQADGSVTRKYGGTGLGLSICRQLVNIMGGRIWVESTPGEGSTFFFTLPFDRQPEENPCLLIAPRDMQDLKVLVADDNEIARIILKEILSAFDNFQITVTGSGPEALAELKNALTDRPYDLVVVDWRMPDMDGFEVARKIRKDPLFIKDNAMPRIIMVTMYGREEVFQRIKAEDNGIDGFVFKPVSSSAMFNSIMKAFGRDEALVPASENETWEFDSKALERIKGAAILLAEDNEINQEVTITLLERAGLIADVAKNGLEALEILRYRIESDTDAPLYDLVLMDIEMPEMDGYEATRIIRSKPEFDNMPVIAMTAHALKGDREKCLDAGMNDYLTKPVAEQHLYAILCKWIKPGNREIPSIISSRQQITDQMPSDFPHLLPGINLKAAVTRLSCSEKIIRKMLQNFSEEYEYAADDIQKFIDQGRVQDAQRVVHSIKGISGNLCAEDLFLASQNLETALKDQKTEEIPLLSEEFKEKLTVVISSLKSLESEKQETVPAVEMERWEADSDKIRDVMEEMYTLLKKKRSHGWKLLDTLLGLLPDAGFHEEKIVLEKSMNRLDTQKALSLLSELAHKLNISMKGDGE